MDLQTLKAVMGNAPGVNYAALLDGYNNAMKAAGVNNVRRAAMFAAQLRHESGGLRWMREIASGAEYEWRSDLGNNYAGDGVRFAGRGPIQLTGRNNYRAFTQWARANGHSNIDFEAQPEKLEEPHWGFLAASYYWVAARPDINSLCDAGDVVTVTRRINGGTNGLSVRQQYYNEALAFGNRLLPGGATTPAPQAVEKVLPYSRAQVAQDTFYYCGPASTQTVVWAATGNLLTERELAGKLGTTTDGTNWIGLFPNVLNSLVPGAGYRSVEMPNDPPSNDQREQLWSNLRNSIDAGFGAIANIVAPPSNYPRASYKSDISPSYGGGTVYHYIAVMGYAIDDYGERHVWIADSGFSPYGYWMTLNQLSTLIPPKGYAYSTAKPKNSILGGLFMALSEARQEELASKIDRIHFELTERFQSRYVNPETNERSQFRDTLVGYMLENDAKNEHMMQVQNPMMLKAINNVGDAVRALVNKATGKKEK